MRIDIGRRRALPGKISAYLPRWMSRVPAHAWALGAVLLVALVLRLWPLGGLATDYDEGVYWQSLRAMARGEPLYTSVFSSQPPFFLVSLYPLYVLFGQTLVAARLAIVTFSLGGIAAMYALGRATAGRWCGVLAAALLALAPVYGVESRTLQAEAPSLFWQIVAVALAAVAARRAGRRQQILAVASGAALGLGIMTKLWDVAAAPPALLYLSGFLAQRPSATTLAVSLRRAAPTLALWCAGLVAAIVVVLLPFPAHLDLVYDQAVRFHSVASGAVNRGLAYNVRFLAQSGSLYPLLILAAIATALAFVRRSRLAVPALIWLAMSLAILLQQQPLFDHHRVLLAPPLALLGALALPLARPVGADRSDQSPQARFVGPLRRALPVILAVALLVGLGVSMREARAASADPPPLQQQAAAALARFTIPDDAVAADDQYVAGLADRDVLPQLVDTSQVRIASGFLTTGQVERLITSHDVRAVLFASGRFDLLPGFRAWVEQHFTRVADFPNGGALYLKMPQGPQIT